MERIYREPQRPAAIWLPHEYMLVNADEAARLPTEGIPAGSEAYTVDESLILRMGADGQWQDVTDVANTARVASRSAASAASSAAAAAASAAAAVLTEETVSGTDPVITAEANHRYLCGEVASLSFTPSATGGCEVVFTSGATPTVLTLPDTVRMPDWFDGTLEANRTYAINIQDGVYGVMTSWA